MPAATDPPRIPLGEAAALLPRDGGGRPVHVQTLRKWATRGAKAADGRKVKLWTVKVGRRRATTRAAVEAFVAELNAVAAT